MPRRRRRARAARAANRVERVAHSLSACQGTHPRHNVLILFADDFIRSRCAQVIYRVATPHDIERALAGACPIVASYGAKDMMLRSASGRLECALTSLGVDHDVKEYPDAGHAFLNDHDPREVPALLRVTQMGCHEPSARDARQRIIAFFNRHLR